jgi:hypothetical protein
MKPNPKPEKDEVLRGVLREWVVESPLPPRFQEQVWQRITRAEVRPEPAVWAGLLRLVGVFLPRPGIALSYLAALLVLGVVAGSWAAQVKASRLDADLGLRYVQSLDPYRSDSAHP